MEKYLRPAPSQGATAVIATTLGGGYGRTGCWKNCRDCSRLEEVDDCDAIIAHGEKSFARAAIARSGYRGENLSMPGGTRILPVERSWSCQVWAGLTQATLRLLNEFAGPTPAGMSLSFPEKIYVSRSGARRRRVTNEDTLWESLQAHGFTRLHLETLSWEETDCGLSIGQDRRCCPRGRAGESGFL